jgi:23S rRNA pseudoU1915 N3-methylase RlmH
MRTITKLPISHNFVISEKQIDYYHKLMTLILIFKIYSYFSILSKCDFHI